MMWRGTSLFVAVVAVFIGGCADRPRPEWAASKPTAIDTSAEDGREQQDISLAIASLHRRSERESCDVLALSSGGQAGAFGAGLIEGWTGRGNRPEFALVTGVSTGSLIGVFAFLGPEGDATLREMYTTHGQSDVINPRWWVELPSADSYARSSPLRAMVMHYITDDIVRRVGEEGSYGRVLLVCTTNMDLCRPRFWNLSALAGDQTRPLADRAARFREILMASMAIPALMPPVFLDGHMHVDGGLVRQLFVIDPAHSEDFREALGPHPRLWLVANRFISTPPKVINDRMIPIVGRSVQAMMDANLEKDIREARRFASDCGGTVCLAFAPMEPDKPEPGSMFDCDYMKRLHQHGLAFAWNGSSPGEPIRRANSDQALDPQKSPDGVGLRTETITGP